MALLAQFKTDFGTVRVTRDSDGTLAYYQNGSYHSQANRRGTSVCAYVHVIHEIVRQSHARDILVIGCAGGTLATMLRRLNCRVTAIDLNPMAFTIARRYFQLPADVRCIRRDGIAYLETTRTKYNAVIVDVFGAHNAVPAPFTTEYFFRTLPRVLTPNGIMVMNTITHDDGDHRADSIARHAEAAGLDIQIYDWPGERDRNTLIASNIKPTVHIPSGKEPVWIRPDLKGIICRRPYKHR